MVSVQLAALPPHPTSTPAALNSLKVARAVNAFGAGLVSSAALNLLYRIISPPGGVPVPGAVGGSAPATHGSVAPATTYASSLPNKV